MNQQIFVPVTDEIIYNHPEQIEGPLIPYSAGMECQNWLSIEINPDEDSLPISSLSRVESANQVKANKPRLRLAYSS